MGTGGLVLVVVLSMLTVLFSVAMLLGYVRYRRRNRELIEQAFGQVMALSGNENLQTLKDSITLGDRNRYGIKPFEVYRILYGPPDRWFVYIHVEGSEPLLMPISQQRAMAAVNVK